MAECQECKTVIRKGIVVSKCGARLNEADVTVKTSDVDLEKPKKSTKKEVSKKSEDKIFDYFDETYINEEENNE